MTGEEATEAKTDMVEEKTSLRDPSPLLDGRGDDEQAAASKVAAAANARPEREATIKDYVRVFTYANKWDYPFMVAAALASIGAGVVSLPVQPLTMLLGGSGLHISPADYAVDECGVRQARRELCQLWNSRLWYVSWNPAPI